jgi:hypothetical protein
MTNKTIQRKEKIMPSLSLDETLKLINKKQYDGSEGYIRWERFDRDMNTFYGEMHEIPSVSVELKDNDCTIYAEYDLSFYLDGPTESRKTMIAKYQDERFRIKYTSLKNDMDGIELEEIVDNIREIKKILRGK